MQFLLNIYTFSFIFSNSLNFKNIRELTYEVANSALA